MNDLELETTRTSITRLKHIEPATTQVTAPT